MSKAGINKLKQTEMSLNYGKSLISRSNNYIYTMDIKHHVIHESLINLFKQEHIAQRNVTEQKQYNILYIIIVSLINQQKFMSSHGIHSNTKTCRKCQSVNNTTVHSMQTQVVFIKSIRKLNDLWLFKS
jgi:hypothetical protein